MIGLGNMNKLSKAGHSYRDGPLRVLPLVQEEWTLGRPCCDDQEDAELDESSSWSKVLIGDVVVCRAQVLDVPGLA